MADDTSDTPFDYEAALREIPEPPPFIFDESLIGDMQKSEPGDRERFRQERKATRQAWRDRWLHPFRRQHAS